MSHKQKGRRAKSRGRHRRRQGNLAPIERARDDIAVSVTRDPSGAVIGRVSGTLGAHAWPWVTAMVVVGAVVVGFVSMAAILR